MNDSVIIEPLRKDDDRGLFRLVDKERLRLSMYFPVTCARCPDARATRIYIKEILARSAKREFFCFVMRDYEGGDPIGLVFLKEFDWSIPKCETAYFISSIYERRGMTSMALIWATDHAFTELGMQKDVARERPRTEARDFGVQLEALERHARPALGVDVRRHVDRGHAEFLLDEERAAVGDLVGAHFGRPGIGHGLGRHLPGALRLAADTQRNDGFDARHEVARAVPGRGDFFERREVGDAHRQRAALLAVLEDRLFGGRGVDAV